MLKTKALFSALWQASVCLLLLFLPAIIFGQPADSLPDADVNPVKGMAFHRYLSVRSGLLKMRYNLACISDNDTVVSPLNKPGWDLVFYDDFDSLNKEKWRLGQAWGEYIPSNSLQYFAKNAIETKNGYLYLNTIKQPKSFKIGDSTVTMPYGVGLINSDLSFMQKYGYFEIRSKNPTGPATWNAFWLTGAHRWPPEIDIFEMYGGKAGKSVHRQHSTIHWGVNGKKSRGYLVKSLPLEHNSDTVFHIYACEWTPKHIKFYTDGKLTRYQRVNKKLRKWMDDEMVVVINNGLEESYAKYLPADFTSNSFIVDWVRVYRQKPGN